MERLKRKQYSANQLESALIAINNGASIYETSKKFGIPRTNLRDKRNNKYFNENCGVQPVFTKEEERQLIDWIHYLGRLGFPVTKEQLLESVSKLVGTLNRPHPFKDGVPGRHWLQSFMKRHPTIAKRIAQNLQSHRNEVKEESIRSWFGRVRQYFEQNNLVEVLNDPTRIFNCDETAFFLCPKAKQVIVQRGSKKVYTRVANDEKECLTVLINVSADGEIAPPMVLYPYKRMPKNLVPTVPSGWAIGNTESGWMNMGAFYEYITNCFHPWLIRKEVPFPIVLFLDGHTSHISLPLSSFCKENKIILVALLPNSTHVLQPLDVAVFRPIKATWKNVVNEFRIKNNFAKMKRTDFAPQVKICLDSCLTKKTIINGFRSCGIYPFEPNNVNYSKLLQEIQSTTSNHNSDTAEGSDSNTVNSIPNQHHRTEQNMKTFKQLFEDRLSPSVLKAFHKSESVWIGDIRYKKLFEFWRNIESNDDDEERNLEIGDTTLVNNICDGTELDTLTFEVTPSLIVPAGQNYAQEISNLTVNDTLTFPVDQVLPENTKGLEPNYVADSMQKSYTNENLRTSTPKPSTSMESKNVNMSTQPLGTAINNRSEYCKTPLKSSITTKSENIPKDLNISTPFKTALYFPDIKDTTKKRVCKRVTPTVATSDEFMAYQRKIEIEKIEREEKKRKRNEDLEKKKKDKLNKQSNSKAKLRNKSEPAPKEGTSDSEDEFQLQRMPQRRNISRQPFANLSLKSESNLKPLPSSQTNPYQDTALKLQVLTNDDYSSDDCNMNRPAKTKIQTKYDLGFDSESNESIF